MTDFYYGRIVMENDRPQKEAPAGYRDCPRSRGIDATVRRSWGGHPIACFLFAALLSGAAVLAIVLGTPIFFQQPMLIGTLGLGLLTIGASTLCLLACHLNETRFVFEGAEFRSSPGFFPVGLRTHRFLLRDIDYFRACANPQLPSENPPTFRLAAVVAGEEFTIDDWLLDAEVGVLVKQLNRLLDSANAPQEASLTNR